MRTRTRAAIFGPVVVTASLAAVSPALALWSTAGSGSGASASSSIGAPATASAVATPGATATSITVSWTAPAGGAAPTGYRVERVSPAATVCTTAAAVLSCTDAGRTPSTSYGYNVIAVRSNWTGTASSAATSTAADTTAPVLTADCPGSGQSYATGNNGSSSWVGKCGTAAKVTATDNAAVVSVAVKVQKGTACFTGTAFTVAQCTAAGPAGYPAGYVAAANGGGNSWSVALTQDRLIAAGTGTYTFSAEAKDTANTSSTLSFTFTTT